MTCHQRGEPLGGRSVGLLATMLLVVVAGCTSDAIQWDDPTYAGPPGPTVTIERGESIPASACEASVRTARSASTLFGAWWELRSNGSATLVFARMDSSGRGTRVVADSADRSARDCGRTAPAIAVSRSGRVHLAYFAEPAQGPGIFYVHSIDNGLTFHSPIAVVFGDKPAAVSVAEDGDNVAVAYEDPNSERSAVGVALSRTMGHIFSIKDAASPPSSRATLPMVRIEGHLVRVWWSERSPIPTASATRTVYREGHW